MFINILKIRLISLNPDISRTIVRNEAHVRLATSVWYASSILLILSTTILILLSVIIPRCLEIGIGSTLFISSSFSFLLFLFCIGMRHHLRKCIHYMRVREVIYVLETAYIAEKLFNNTTIFSDLIHKQDDHECKKCTFHQEEINGNRENRGK